MEVVVEVETEAGHGNQQDQSNKPTDASQNEFLSTHITNEAEPQEGEEAENEVEMTETTKTISKRKKSARSIRELRVTRSRSLSPQEAQERRILRGREEWGSTRAKIMNPEKRESVFAKPKRGRPMTRARNTNEIQLNERML